MGKPHSQSKPHSQVVHTGIWEIGLQERNDRGLSFTLGFKQNCVHTEVRFIPWPPRQLMRPSTIASRSTLVCSALYVAAREPCCRVCRSCCAWLAQQCIPDGCAVQSATVRFLASQSAIVHPCCCTAVGTARNVGGSQVCMPPDACSATVPSVPVSSLLESAAGQHTGGMRL